MARRTQFLPILALVGAALLPTRVVAQSAPPSARASSPAEPTPEAAVNAFMKAVADSNLARMTYLWGTQDGPAAITRKPPDFQKRMYITYAFLKGGTYKISIVEPVPAKQDRRNIILEFRRGDCNKMVPIVAVKTKDYGWIVEALNLNDVGVPGRSCSGGPPSGAPQSQSTVIDTVKPAPESK